MYLRFLPAPFKYLHKGFINRHGFLAGQSVVLDLQQDPTVT